MRKKVKSSPGFSDLSHSAGMMRLRKAPWLSNSALPLAPAQVASVNPVARASAGKYLPLRSPSTWNDLTIRGSSQPILPRARSLKAWAPATRRMTGSVHWVSGQPSLPPTARGATPSALALSMAAVNSAQVFGTPIPSFSSCCGEYQTRALTLPLK
jgi:hypothetical protein